MDNQDTKNIVDVVDVVKYVPSRFRDLIGSIIKLNENGIFHESSCPFCSSKHRFEAESIYESTPQYQSDKYDFVKKFFDGKNEPISFDVIVNHCGNHINKGVEQLRKIEYIQTIDNIASTKMSTLEEIDIVLAALKERMIEINKISGDSRTSKIESEVLKSNVVSQISKSFSSLLKLRSEILGEMRKDGDMISIDREKFKQAFNNALDSTKNEREKQIVIDLLKNLSRFEDKSTL